MPVRAWVARTRRPLGAALVISVVVAVCSFIIARRGDHVKVNSICHPNLSHLRNSDGRDVLLVGTLPLDLDGASEALVANAIGALRPDVVMVQGTWTAGVNAMILSGRWELDGAPPMPSASNWTDIGDAAPVELSSPRKHGWFSLLGGPPPRFPERSLVPVKVGSWVHYLRGAVGGDIAAAVTSAAKFGVPVHYLGPADGGFQGHVQVSLLAQQAAMELMEEEQQRGAQMAPEDVDAALRRAEAHVREDASKWLRDARSETERLTEHLRARVPAKVRRALTERLEMRTSGTAERIVGTMHAHQRGAVVLSVDMLVAVEEKLDKAGYSYISKCV